MNKYSQRNNFWKDIKLGTSNVTIGSHGCVITCLSMVADTPPNEMNELLKENNAYANGNLVIWSKIPGFNFIERVKFYNNQGVKDVIDKYGFCLVEVDYDGKPRTTKDKHWVLFIGNKRMIDPWTGNEVDTNKYPVLTGYCVLESANPSANSGDMTKELKACLEALHGENGVIKEKEALQRKYDEDVSGLNTTIADKQKEIDSLKPKVNTAESKAQEWEINFKELINSLASKLGCKHDRAAIIAQVEGLITIEDQKASVEGDYASAIGDLNTANEKIQELQDKLESEVKPMSKKKIDFKHALWEATKEPLRWLVLAVLPVLATYLADIDMQWAVYATVILRMIDKVLYEVNKVDPKENIVKLPF